MSKVENVADTIRLIVFTVARLTALPALYSQVPFLALPVIRDIFEYLLEKYSKPLFYALSAFGVFTTIEFKSDEEYNAYKEEALKLIASQEKEAWDADERKKFKASAKKLINLGFIPRL